MFPQPTGRPAAPSVPSAPEGVPSRGELSGGDLTGESVGEYDFVVPPELVAQVPAARRQDARLLVVPRGAAAAAVTLRDAGVQDLPALLRPGDLLVINDTTVAPARLLARRASGGRVTVLVVASAGRTATVMLGARGTLQAGEIVDVDGDAWRIERALGEGRFEIAVERGRDVATLMAEVGRMPLPPYIHRDAAADPRDALDRERYQTTFAAGPAASAASAAEAAAGAAQPGAAPSAGAIAAPTAGLHITPELLAAVAARSVAIARLRLDVGEGTFRPLRGERLSEHVMHSERYEVPEAAAAAYAAARERGGRVVAVGTTVVRTLESAVRDGGRRLAPGPGVTSLFIRPGHRFTSVDALLTNFHQPRSTLIVLVSAFAGADAIRAAYGHAIAARYRFFSYGDAMLIA
jgi:S-adenosylmethionine:tRNA ribosyltransferase-isomerase